MFPLTGERLPDGRGKFGTPPRSYAEVISKLRFELSLETRIAQ